MRRSPTRKHELERWQARGYQVLALSDPAYPENLRVVENRPPLLFVAGQLSPADRRAVAVIGTRQPTDRRACALAREIAEALALAGFTVVSGLAAGIDAEAHRAMLQLAGASVRARRARSRCSGPGSARSTRLSTPSCTPGSRSRARSISQFWPDAPPTRNSFPARNAVMSGMTLGSVIVEASEHSGTRIQARHALAQGRVVVLMPPTLRCEWAAELAEQPGVVVAEDAADVVDVFKR